MFIESWEIKTSKFSAKRLMELPPTAQPELLYYPGATTSGGHDGPIIEVMPNGGTRWLGMFANSRLGASVNGIYEWPPNDQMLCVVADGGGILVNAADPAQWSELDPLPIRGIFPFEDINTLVCYTYTDFYAWNSSGEAWKIDRLALDEIAVTSVEGHILHGWFNSFHSDIERHPFKLDVATGKLMRR